MERRSGGDKKTEGGFQPASSQFFQKKLKVKCVCPPTPEWKSAASIKPMKIWAMFREEEDD